MTEIEFKYNLYKNYKIKFLYQDMFIYSITLLEHNIDVLVSITINDDNVLPAIQINNDNTGTCFRYQSFRKALNRIESDIK